MAIKDIRRPMQPHGWKNLAVRKEIIRAWVEDTNGPTQFISDDDMNQTIGTIIATLPDGIEGFQFASQMYGSDFFNGETLEFCRALSIALNTKFAGFKNYYWLKLAAIPQGNTAPSPTE